MKNSLKIFLFMLLLINSMTLYSQTINLLNVDDDQFDMGFLHAPAFVNNHVIFSGKVASESAVWSFNVATQEKTKLIDGSISQNSSKIIGNEVYFVLYGTDYTVTMWKTDGTIGGTEQVSDSFISFGLYKSNGFVYAGSFQTGLIVTDGETVFTDGNPDINFGILPRLCFFNINDYVSYIPGQLTAVINGVENNIEFSAADLTNKINKIVSFQDECYAVDSDNRDLWRITASGELEMVAVNDSDMGERVRGIYTDGEQVYLLQSDNTVTQHLRRYSTDFNVIEASNTDFTNGGVSITHISLLNGLVGINTTTPTISPQVNSVYILDNDLVNIYGSGNTFVYFADPPVSYKTSDNLLIKVTRRNSISGNIVALYSDLATENQKQLNLPIGQNNRILSNPSSPDALLLSTDSNNTSRLSAIQSIPDIGSILSGNWFNPDFKNQGLNISKGTRSDGTEYVAVTGYTYKDGLPFWFAGNSDITYPQYSIEMDLFEFSGIDMFETENTPDRLLYGTIRLQMLSCNQLNSLITTADEQFDMLLYRIDDVTFNQYCVD